ncbi:hypothetical protein [Paludisphaera rhizosphaerae]|uniref:hypothetical protein n=1 Tax=Paludisphaera rhizosphaerae TaxID=2711216 RepID=UPI0013EC10AA|nr:hypothetical protein [Paludisphaera rhizosphaerae]
MRNDRGLSEANKRRLERAALKIGKAILAGVPLNGIPGLASEGKEPNPRFGKFAESRATPFRSHVIAGFRTPETPAELLELLRIVIDTTTPLLAYPGRDASELEIAFEDGRLATIRVETA